ncbi:uncharacterized protein LOC115401536 [Salarias fasciatus]|uniref:Uncharacterized LOC115401536 n=1 Tax=Salarias fasciatus TaxID=181472 RepID=A0A672J0A8_SALFA|nr:uncharacterized protein LOC115401536 [Salarias fasciatus]
MEESESTARERATGGDGGRESSSRMLNSNKPLHRFLQRESRSLGIVILIFGCAELLMGFQLAYAGRSMSSNAIYGPFWEGTLFAVCGSLSIYTNRNPSKRMVTVCLAMYLVSISGFFVCFGYRIHIFCSSPMMWYRIGSWPWGYNRMMQILSIEALLFVFSVCVCVILIFLSAVARFALKSTHTQVAIRTVTYQQRETTSD